MTEAPDVTSDGHLWLLELVEGVPFQFELRPSGLLRFGVGGRIYRDAEDIPPSVQAAVREVRERFDRDALRQAVDDPTGVTFFGVATRYERIEYDWERLPAFLGTDIWSEADAAFRPPDATAAIFERLGLQPVNALERERPARDFHPGRAEFPVSAWYDGPVAGLLVRNKRSGRAVGRNPDAGTEPEPLDADAASLAEQFATPEQFAAIAAARRERGEAVTVDAVLERTVEAIAREQYGRLDAGREQFDPAALRSAAAPLVRTWLDAQ